LKQTSELITLTILSTRPEIPVQLALAILYISKKINNEDQLPPTIILPDKN
jgi:hypothetical protein